MPALQQILKWWRHGWKPINSAILVTLLHLLLRPGSDNIMNPQPNKSAELKPDINCAELKADVPDVNRVELKVVSDVKPSNRAELKAVSARKVLLPIGNGKYVKVSHYRQRPYVTIPDYATTANGQLYATKRGILLHPEEWKELKSVSKKWIKNWNKTV